MTAGPASFPARLIASLVVALGLVSGLGYVASRTIAAPPTGPDATPLHVSAPAPAEVDNSVPAGAPVGVTTVDPAWLAEMVVRTTIPAPALRAYARAQLDGGGGCGVGWTTLAGIGWVESQHGTLGGRRLRSDGTSERPIIGPALDGQGRFAAIPASPGAAAWHGDPVWEHAVGPMQFLPSSWDSWASDGDGDGRADPHDLDDAAVAAARYLCASGGDLTTGEGWSAAVLSYNHDRAYVDAVHAAATSYAARSGG